MYKALASFIVVLAISVTQLFSQISKLNLSYGIGTSSSLGTFRSVDFDNDKAGFAGSGLSTALNIDYKFKNGNLGASLGIHNQNNSFKTDDYETELQRNLIGLNDANVYAGLYQRTSFMIGLNYVYPVNDKSYLTFRLMGGATIGKLPEEEGFLYGSNNLWYVQPAAYTTSPGFSIGGNFRTPLSKKINLNADCNYSASSYEFTNVASYYSTGDISTYTRNISMSSLQLLLGISVDLIR
jgi:hypothetical protein